MYCENLSLNPQNYIKLGMGVYIYKSNASVVRWGIGDRIPQSFWSANLVYMVPNNRNPISYQKRVADLPVYS